MGRRNSTERADSSVNLIILADTHRSISLSDKSITDFSTVYIVLKQNSEKNH